MDDEQTGSLPRVNVSAALIVKEGEILLARRAPGEKLAGHWEFPGGKIEYYETPQEAVERELFEEFGVRARAGAVLCETAHDYGDFIVALVTLRVDILEGELTPTVHDKISWADPAELLTYKLSPADVEVAKLIQSAVASSPP